MATLMTVKCSEMITYSSIFVLTFHLVSSWLFCVCWSLSFSCGLEMAQEYSLVLINTPQIIQQHNAQLLPGGAVDQILNLSLIGRGRAIQASEHTYPYIYLFLKSICPKAYPTFSRSFYPGRENSSRWHVSYPKYM